MNLYFALTYGPGPGLSSGPYCEAGPGPSPSGEAKPSRKFPPFLFTCKCESTCEKSTQIQMKSKESHTESNPQAFTSNSHQQYNMSHVRTVLGVVPRAGRLVPLSILMLLSHQNRSFILSLDPPFSQGIIDATITCPHYYRITISIH